jgi:hypothetical protein
MSLSVDGKRGAAKEVPSRQPSLLHQSTAFAAEQILATTRFGQRQQGESQCSITPWYF